jgi:dTDP-4-dehydrorhamnose 3,5-epimerase
MIFTKTKIKDACIIDLEKHEDERGFFARSWSGDEFHAQSLTAKIVQCSVSMNYKKGTLRGMHYQAAPFREAKIVRCTQGAIYDVVLDLRQESVTFLQWIGVELTAANHKMFFIPEGCAHGFQTLEDQSEVFYQISEKYSPDHARGVRWNDLAFGIIWPLNVEVISERDNNYPDFTDEKIKK